MDLKLFIISHREEYIVHSETGDKYFLYGQISQKRDEDVFIQIRVEPENGEGLISLKKCDSWEQARGIAWRAVGFFDDFDKYIFSTDDFYDNEKIIQGLINFIL